MASRLKKEILLKPYEYLSRSIPSDRELAQKDVGILGMVLQLR
jgi:hypothetical protein